MRMSISGGKFTSALRPNRRCLGIAGCEPCSAWRARYSSSFDDKHGFVVDQGLVAVLSQTVILLDRVIQQCIADVPSRLSVVFAQNSFKQLACVFVAAVVNSIGIKNKNISRTHQRDLSNIGRLELSWS